eukprot:CAMPEP_0183769820 /NCGR_PEP_ID=MMETSP0739-20130205/22904_1 /TAXON_ID=385413 /ORGANISM="Thalassiosira miniscula, Strain CCMP1093" /LENGTH=311 /DNA_ID=CAMNT_0026009527 /DNA_START=294 /DNA_END=1226 /DNA_ORIENTATION=-
MASMRSVPSCVRSGRGAAIQTFTSNTSKPKRSIPSSIKDLVSFFRNIYDETCSILQSVREFFIIEFPVFLTRLIAFVGTIHLNSEYGLKTFQCEGPSMEPTIIDGNFTSVLIDRWSHRIFGLEDTDYDVHENKSDFAGKEKSHTSHQEKNDNSFEGWCDLLSGIWEQHFASGLQRGDVIILHHPLKEATLCKRIIGMPGDTIIRTDGVRKESNRRVVPPGHLWIEGDNAPQSLDSRSYGTVPASLVIGKVICRLWPLREYASLGMDANGMEHWRRVSARIGRGGRPFIANQAEFNGSYLMVNECREKNKKS